MSKAARSWNDYTIVEQAAKGTVFNFDVDRSYGFIQPEGTHASYQRAFYRIEDVIRDDIGRRVLFPGASVEFDFVRDNYSSTGKHLRAIRVREIASEEVNDPETYREFSQVKKWDGTIGTVIRFDGDELAFLGRNIVTEGADSLQPGQWVAHGIGCSAHSVTGKESWHATNVELYPPGFQPPQPEPEPEPVLESFEAIFLNAPELPIDVPTPESVAVGHGLLSPTNRKKTIRELILEKQK